MTKRILVVEDDVDSMVLLKNLLADENYCVLCASNGKEAIQRARDEEPDLILLDIGLPECDGYEVCCCLKENERKPAFRRIETSSASPFL